MFRVNVLAWFPVIASERRGQRLRFHRVGDIDVGQFHQGRADVHLLTQTIDDFPCVVATWRPDDHRDARNLLIHRPLLTVAVIGQTVAVVGGKDDD